MDSRTFYRYVVQMRAEQKKWFATHNRTAYSKAIKLEQIIDAEIERVEKIINPPVEQKELF